MNIQHVFSKAFNQKSKKDFIVFENKTITYGELKKQIGKYTTYLNNSGFKKGDRIVFSSKDESFVCTFFLTLLANGITAVLLDHDGGANRSNAIIDHCQPQAIIIDDELIRKWHIKTTAKIIPIIKNDSNSTLDKLLRKTRQNVTSFPECTEAFDESTIDDNIDINSDAYILFTSGTTSEPKGVRISYYALFTHLKTLTDVYQLDDNSKIFNNLILSHTDGMMQGPVLALFSNSTLYRPFKFSIQRIEDAFDIIYRENISHWIMVPTMIALIYQFKQNDSDTLETKKFKYVISSGGILDSSLWKNFQEKFMTMILNVYGLTETVVGGLFAGPVKASHIIGTIGIPVDCNAKVVNKDGTNAKVGEHGLIHLSGSMLMSGYLNAPEANKEVFPEEWFNTGDIGFQGKDGCYRIVGRENSTIISGGVNISPEEITEVLQTHPSVQEAITFGITNEIWGEIVACAIVRKAQMDLDEDIIVDYCRYHLEERKVPSKVYFLDSLPRGRSGKVMIPSILKTISTLDQETESESELLPSFIQIVANSFQTPLENVTMDMVADDTPAWDSISYLLLIGALEKRFSIVFKPIEVMSINALSELFELVRKKLNQ